MPGWGKPQYEMKQADIPKGDIPKAFDWRDKGRVYERLRVLWSSHKMVVCVTGCNPFHLQVMLLRLFCFFKGAVTAVKNQVCKQKCQVYLPGNWSVDPLTPKSD